MQLLQNKFIILIFISLLSACQIKTNNFVNHLLQLPNLKTEISKWCESSQSITIYQNGNIITANSIQLKFLSAHTSSKAYYILEKNNISESVGIMINNNALYIIESSSKKNKDINWSQAGILFAK